MNLLFNDKNDILNHTLLVAQLKEKQLIQSHYFNLMSLHNFLVDPFDVQDSFSFYFSPQNNTLKEVYTFKNGARNYKKYPLHPEDFIKRLNGLGQKDFSYSFKNNYYDELEFMTKGSHPKALEKFILNYHSQLKNRNCIAMNIKNEEYNKFREYESEYLDSRALLDTKKLYTKLRTSISRVETKQILKSIDIYFEHGITKIGQELSIKHFVFHMENENKAIPVNIKITHWLANMLSKDSIEKDNINIINIKNTPEGWDSFDRNTLDTKYDLFSKIILSQKLSKELSTSNKPLKLKKI